MGLHIAGGNIVNTSCAFSGSPQNAADFVVFLKDNLTGMGGAGWDLVGTIKAKLSFLAVAFVSGNLVTLNGNGYKFFIPPDEGDVLIGSSMDETLNTWGTLVHSRQGWNYEIITSGGNKTIKFTNINDNMLFNNVVPSGTVGIFDFSPDGVGTGRTWGGGYTVASQKVSIGAQALTLKLTTVNTNGIIAITPSDDVVSYDGILAQAYNLLANKYQFMLMVDGGGSTNGTFFFASHLKPARGVTFCNYMNGPVNAVARNGGSRPGFSGIGEYYYVNNGSPFTDVVNSDFNKSPAICIPGYGYGVTNTDKLDNPIDGLPFRDDLGNALAFDAFLAGPRIIGDEAHILGWIWDALVYSNSISQDAQHSAQINGKAAYCVLSQVGSRFISQGSLVILREI